MRALHKTRLMGSAAGAALVLGLAGPALAFEEVDWEWNKSVDELVVKRVTINAEIVPTGMVEVEKVQIQIGDVSATSEIHDVDNSPFREGAGGGGAAVLIDETFNFSSDYDDDQDPGPITPVAGTDDGDSLIQAELVGGSFVDEGDDTVGFNVQVTGEIPIELVGGESLDAEIELPAVESTATAVGNNQQISSNVAIQLHDGQYLFDTCTDCDNGPSVPGIPGLPNGNGPDDPGDAGETQVDDGTNELQDVAFLLGIGAIAGVIDAADISATSNVYDITNATVESAATAVGNNVNVELDAATPGDAVMIADLTQFSYANVSASSMVNNVSVTGYHNLTSVSPIVSSAATAVGNNVSITVSSPLAGGGVTPTP